MKAKEIPLQRSYTIRVNKSKSPYAEPTIHGITTKGEGISKTLPGAISVVLPAQFCARLGIKEGDTMMCRMNEDNDIVFQKLYSLVGEK